ncbi:ferredoxin--NADP reductase [Nocardia canadensis]|uniref:ferredoxin--NADP reductase n=1 Tax=Nocardia canadensis TaxID=3065238 RepID=UPI0029315E66|nr:ferredoxin--NADP reductase [Nocardia canadensis]
MARPMFQPATVTRIIKESADARTFVLSPHDEPVAYRAGQFCAFRVRVGGKDIYRSYSMSSAPEVDNELMTTVKRVSGGVVSNWLHDNVTEGDVVEISRASGKFCLRETDAPLLGFSGGSGITPILSLTKTALATTERRVRLLCADRDHSSMIFEATLSELSARHPGRLEVVRHLDNEGGLLTPAAITTFVGGDAHADSYVCGPEAFMEMVERALPSTSSVFSERFGAPSPLVTAPPASAEPAASVEALASMASPGTPGIVTIFVGRKKATVPHRAGETLLQAARRAKLNPPYSCEQGSCATCMARLTEGTATMAVNEALTEEEVTEGYVLTCQAVPDTPSVTVRYD